MTVVVVLLIFWISMIWLGNTLVYLSSVASVVDSTTNIPVNTLNKIYFVGYNIFTLGNGDLKGGNEYWKIYSAIVSVSGLSILTIAISYIVQILSAVTDKRHLSIYISSMGDSPQDILLQAWNGKDFLRIEPHLLELTTRILYHDQNHLAFPILHQFHSTSVKDAAAVNLVALDEALSIFLFCIPVEHRPAALDLNSLRKAITAYLINLEATFFPLAKETPPIPDLQELKDAGIPLIKNQAQIDQYYTKIADRRRLLLAFLRHEAWDWSDLTKPRFPVHPKLTQLTEG